MEKKYGYVYDDTVDFIDYIIADYDFYGQLIEIMQNGNSEIALKNKQLLKQIDENWLNAIEAALPSLDICIRTPMRFLKEHEQVMPIELSKNINAKSIRHLAQHTDYINKIEGDVITPSKILNVYRDETLDTYENKFIYTLIDRLFSFVQRRYIKLCEFGKDENKTNLTFETQFYSEKTTAKINFSIEIENNDELGEESNHEKISNWARVEKIRGILADYLNSDIAKNLKGKFIRPPVMRTNAIMKNKDLKTCLELWQFIESYDKIGYELVVNETANKPNDAYIKQLYSLLALQYVTFKQNLDDVLDSDKAISRRQSHKPFTPKIVTDFEEIESDDFNVYDVIEHKFVKITQASSRRKLTENEINIRTALEDALEADKKLIILEKERIKQEEEKKKKEEEQRIFEEQEKQRKLIEEEIRKLKEDALNKKRVIENEKLKQTQLLKQIESKRVKKYIGKGIRISTRKKTLKAKIKKPVKKSNSFLKEKNNEEK